GSDVTILAGPLDTVAQSSGFVELFLGRSILDVYTQDAISITPTAAPLLSRLGSGLMSSLESLSDLFAESLRQPIPLLGTSLLDALAGAHAPEFLSDGVEAEEESKPEEGIPFLMRLF